MLAEGCDASCTHRPVSIINSWKHVSKHLYVYQSSVSKSINSPRCFTCRLLTCLSYICLSMLDGCMLQCFTNRSPSRRLCRAQTSWHDRLRSPNWLPTVDESPAIASTVETPVSAATTITGSTTSILGVPTAICGPGCSLPTFIKVTCFELDVTLSLVNVSAMRVHTHAILSCAQNTHLISV